MKLNHLLLITMAGLTPAIAVQAAAPKTTTSRAAVVFLEPEKFTDVKGSAMDTGDRNGYLKQIRDFVGQQATAYVPEGQNLAITFTDIDMAGDFPPGRSAAADDIRVIKDIYPPRITFSFRVTDAAGNVVKQGDRELTDNAFMTTMALTDRQDPLRYEKALLNDWFRKEFPKSK